MSINEYPIRTSFQISNLDGLQEETTIRFSSGLDVAWSTFATEMVANVTRDWRQQPPLKAERVSNSAKVSAITKTKCGPTDHLDATCLTIDAEYSYRAFFEAGSDPAYVNDFFLSSTNTKISDGTLQYILQRESPGTPLVVGNIQREGVREFAESNTGNNNNGNSSNNGGGGGGGGGLPGWAGFFIFLLVMVLILGPLYYFLAKEKKKSPYNDQETTWKDFLVDYFGRLCGGKKQDDNDDALPMTAPKPEPTSTSTGEPIVPGAIPPRPPPPPKKKKAPTTINNNKKQRRTSKFPSNQARGGGGSAAPQQQTTPKRKPPQTMKATPTTATGKKPTNTKKQQQEKQQQQQDQERYGEENMA